MPLGFERLNERTQRPNAHINFIKPLTSTSTTDQAIAKAFLERIAAQCYPVMKRDYISVMSLEEFPANNEFLGRNFNAGETIQLVLKDKRGQWLSFRFVQMVMMHELAHCKQMNHSKFFWQVHGRYAEHMKELWGKRYTGEGLWGRGQDLTSGQFVHDRSPDKSDIPEHLCGGTYRRARGRKRKRGQADKPTLNYAERQQKRIARKFGKHGDGKDLGEDELVRGAIETMKGGKRSYGKPKVANSKRGRELRANAALARFEAAKTIKQEDSSDFGEDDGSDTEWSEDEDKGGETFGFDGKKIKDEEGHDMFRVCGDEGDEQRGYQDEILRSMGIDMERNAMSEVPESESKKTEEKHDHEDDETESETSDTHPSNADAELPPSIGFNYDKDNDDSETDAEDLDRRAGKSANGTTAPALPSPRTNDPPHINTASSSNATATTDGAEDLSASLTTTCPICSLENESAAPTCVACANVLNPKLVPNHWRCKSKECEGTKYLNAGDAGRCGLCGSQRPSAPVSAGSRERTVRPMGVVAADVLRWD